MGVDMRTRTDGGTVPVDPGQFFEQDLPVAFETCADLLRDALGRLSPRSLTIEVDGSSAWTLSVLDGRALITTATDTGNDILQIDHHQLDDLVTDQATPMAWFSSGALTLHGRLETLLDWWLVLRGALDGVAPHVGAMAFRDRRGQPLDLSRAFSLSDSDQDMGHFLEEAGFLHVEGVFSEREMSAISEDIDTAMPGYRRGDGQSWWACTSDGEDRLVRMQGFERHSAPVSSFGTDERLARLAALPGDGHVWGSMQSNSVEALIKPIGIVEGISDVPWHKDCSLGRHSYECCSLTVGVSVTGADANSGQLRAVAGSHRALVWPALLRKDSQLPVVDLPTRSGDVTVHLSCTMHMAQPPVNSERRVLYTTFRLPPRQGSDDDSARQRIRAVREAAAVTVSQPAAR